MNAQVKEQKQNRLDRELDSREMTFQRPMAWSNPETLPAPKPRAGWKHRWIRLSILGNGDPSNISSKLREGYEPCKAEDYPELMMHAALEGRFQGGIEVGGLLLCRIPEEFLKQRDAYFNKMNQDQMSSVDNSYMRDNDPRMQKFAERSSKVSFGPGS